MFPSTLSSFVLLIAKALDGAGVDSRSVFEQAGLDYEKLKDANARFPYVGIYNLWRLSVARTNDPNFGFKVAEFWHPTTFHALGYAWLASATLYEAFSRAARYAHIMNNAIELRLSENDECVFFEIDDSLLSPRPIDQVYDATLALLVHMCRISSDASFSPLKVITKRERPRSPEHYIRFFGAPIEFAAQTNRIYLDKAQLAAPLPTANATLARINEKIVADYLARLDSEDILMRVKSRLIERLPSGVMSEVAVAASLNMSLRTLQRRLKGKGTSYKELLEQTRKDLAAKYIEDSTYSINEITYLLGFSEPSNFSRAFKRWTGVSPSTFRESG